MTDCSSRASKTRSLMTGRRPPDQAALLASVLSAIPSDLRPAALPSGPRASDRAVCRYLAAHAFANWTAHLGGGLRTWLTSLHAAAALVAAGAGVGGAD